MKQKKNSAFHWLLRLAAQCRGKMILSVLLAVAGAFCGVVPYFAVSRIVILVCGWQYELAPIWVIWEAPGLERPPPCSATAAPLPF